MVSVKLQKTITNLSKNYLPFRLLSPDRFKEMVNLVRIVELQEDEIFQIKGGENRDYLFVMEGRIEVIENGAIRCADAESTKNRPLLMAIAPDKSTVCAKEDSIICHAKRQTLDDLISWDGIHQFTCSTDNELYARMDLVRNSLVFKRLPLAVVEEAFRRMKTVEVKAGQEVIRQGEDGDAYYVIDEGFAEAFQLDVFEEVMKKVVDLKKGDAFGSAALISGRKRDETVRMVSDGKLLVLSNKDFQELIRKPLIKSVNPKVALTMIETDHLLLDVRYEEEHEDQRIAHPSQLIPLPELSKRVNELDRNSNYVIYCRSGVRSAVAALFLTELNFEVVNLEGGILAWPFEVESMYAQK